MSTVRISDDFYAEDADTTYHGLRFNVKPDSIASHGGQITLQDPAIDASALVAASFDSDTGEAVHFSGTQSAAKEVDCVMIWDDAQECYILHRLSSFSRITKVKTAPPKPKIAEPSIRIQAPTPTSSTSRARSNTPAQSSPRVQPAASVPVPRIQQLPSAVSPSRPISSPQVKPISTSTTASPRPLPSPSIGGSFSLQQQQQQPARPKTGGKTLPTKPAVQSTGLYSDTSESGSEAESSDSDEFADLAGALSQR